MNIRMYVFPLLFFSFFAMEARPKSKGKEPSFKKIVRMESLNGFTKQKLCAMADTVLLYQFPSGGWPKNHHWEYDVLPDDEWTSRCEVLRDMKRTGIGSTIDNGATTCEMIYLARVYAMTHREEYRAAVMRGIEYLLNMQYDNGGWPQFYPSRRGSYDHVKPYADFITFNDNAMVNVMRLLWDVARNREPFAVLQVDAALRERCQQAFDKGVQCILACQIRKNGKLTVWCQQHNDSTLLPEHARAYELPSFTGANETPAILDLLMDLPNPSPEVQLCIASAIQWLEAHALHDVKLEHFKNADGEKDVRLVACPGAPLLWARYYDLETEQPYFCDRDGIKRANLDEVGYERRVGYGWIGSSPAEVIERYYKTKKR